MSGAQEVSLSEPRKFRAALVQMRTSRNVIANIDAAAKMIREATEGELERETPAPELAEESDQALSRQPAPPKPKRKSRKAG